MLNYQKIIFFFITGSLFTIWIDEINEDQNICLSLINEYIPLKSEPKFFQKQFNLLESLIDLFQINGENRKQHYEMSQYVNKLSKHAIMIDKNQSQINVININNKPHYQRMNQISETLIKKDNIFSFLNIQPQIITKQYDIEGFFNQIKGNIHQMIQDDKHLIIAYTQISYDIEEQNQIYFKIYERKNGNLMDIQTIQLKRNKKIQNMDIYNDLVVYSQVNDDMLFQTMIKKNGQFQLIERSFSIIKSNFFQMLGIKILQKENDTVQILAIYVNSDTEACQIQGKIFTQRCQDQKIESLNNFWVQQTHLFTNDNIDIVIKLMQRFDKSIFLMIKFLIKLKYYYKINQKQHVEYQQIDIFF